jgi:peptidyl-prolyl cis-trans isomerase SurA
MTNRILSSLVWVLAALWSVGGSAAVQWIDEIVAVAGQDVIPRSELEMQMKIIAGELGASGKSMERKLLLKQVLDKMILESLQVQRAKSMGIHVDEALVDQTIRKIAAENRMDLLRFRKALQEEGLDFDSFRENIRRELIISKLQERIRASKVNVSDREIDELLATNTSQKGANNRYRLRHILIAVPEAASPEQLEKARKQAEKIRRRAVEGGDFARLAASFSNGSNALKGGDLGWRAGDELPTLFADTVRKMKAGEVSEIIHSPSGFHIIKVEQIEGGADTPSVEQRRARHILITTSDVMTDSKARKTLTTLRARIQRGEDFGKLAKQYSDDEGSAKQGGDLGWAIPGTYVPAFEKTLAMLKPGEISKPFKSKFGWHIVQLQDRRVAPIDKGVLRQRARGFLVKQKQDEALELWLRRLRNASFVEYRLPELQDEKAGG